MPIEFFGFTIGKKSQQKSPANEVKSFVKPESDDGSFVIDGGGYYQTVIDFDGNAKNEIEYVNQYREMAMHPEVQDAIEDVVNEAISHDNNKKSVELVLDRVDLSDNIKERIHEEFGEVYSLLNFETKGYELFRRWYIDGKLLHHMVVDPKNVKKGIIDVKFICPTKIQKVVETETIEKDGVKVTVEGDEYYVYRETEGQTEGLRIAPEAVSYVTSGLYDANSRRVMSYLQKAIKPLNQLRMIEDAVVIYRISRAPERRVFYIDVGSLPKTKAEQYVRGIMNKYRNKLVYDAKTGNMRDDKRHMSMLEDFWLPRREGGKGTEISTLDGGQNLGEMEDVLYFQKKLFQALNIPKSRYEQDAQFQIGRASEVNRDEVKFMRFIERLRSKFDEMFMTMLRTQCLLKGVMTVEDWEKIDQDISFEHAKDNHFAELKDYEILTERMNILRDVDDHIGKYFSIDWVRKHILRQSDEDIRIMDKQIAREREEGLITTDDEF